MSVWQSLIGFFAKSDPHFAYSDLSFAKSVPNFSNLIHSVQTNICKHFWECARPESDLAAKADPRTGYVYVTFNFVAMFGMRIKSFFALCIIMYKTDHVYSFLRITFIVLVCFV